MKSDLSYGPAKIYQFPVGGRAALLGRRCGETQSSIDQGTLGLHETICSSSWYHEEAIQDAKPGWER